jgi:hypothetical protein
MLSNAFSLYQPASHIKLISKYLGLQVIRFKFHDRIRQRTIIFQSAILQITEGDKRLYASRRSAKLCPTSNKHPRSTQGAYFQSYARSANQHVQISQGLSIDFYMCSSAYKKQEAPDRRSLTQQKLWSFTWVELHTKSKGLSIDGQLLSKNLGFLYV